MIEKDKNSQVYRILIKNICLLSMTNSEDKKVTVRLFLIFLIFKKNYFLNKKYEKIALLKLLIL